MKHLVINSLAQAKRVVIIVIGFTMLVAGIALIVFPGPAIIVIPIGLGILATEFVWARNLLHKIKERLPKRASKVHPNEVGGN